MRIKVSYRIKKRNRHLSLFCYLINKNKIKKLSFKYIFWKFDGTLILSQSRRYNIVIQNAKPHANFITNMHARKSLNCKYKYFLHIMLEILVKENILETYSISFDVLSAVLTLLNVILVLNLPNIISAYSSQVISFTNLLIHFKITS